jgi:hypothetical protein
MIIHVGTAINAGSSSRPRRCVRPQIRDQSSRGERHKQSAVTWRGRSWSALTWSSPRTGTGPLGMVALLGQLLPRRSDDHIRRREHRHSPSGIVSRTIVLAGLDLQHGVRVLDHRSRRLTNTPQSHLILSSNNDRLNSSKRSAPDSSDALRATVLEAWPQ